jgi:hypothetical protein
VAYYKMTDPEYWESPGRFGTIDHVIPTVRHTFFVLGDAEREQGQAALVMKMEPGHVVNSHGHTSGVLEVIVEGSLQVGDVVLTPGDVMVLEPGEACGRAVAGPDGCTTVEFFSTVQGAHQLIYRTPDGDTLDWDVLQQRRRPESSEISSEGATT